MVAMFVEGF